jgi:hypothetical protein
MELLFSLFMYLSVFISLSVFTVSLCSQLSYLLFVSLFCVNIFHMLSLSAGLIRKIPKALNVPAPLLKLALVCVEYSPEKRPTMKQAEQMTSKSNNKKVSCCNKPFISPQLQ